MLISDIDIYTRVVRAKNERKRHALNLTTYI